MSDPLSSLLVQLRKFEPEELLEGLLSVQERQNKTPPPDKKNFTYDELRQWLRARKLRDSSDQHRLLDLLDATRLDEADVVPPTPMLRLRARQGIASGKLIVENGLSASTSVDIEITHGTYPDGGRSLVELVSPCDPLLLSIGERLEIPIQFRIVEHRAASRLILPLELRNKKGVLGRAFVEVSDEAMQTPELPHASVTLRHQVVPELLALGRLRRAILLHPEGARALYASLVAEGRRFARSPEGERWAKRLATSPRMRRLRLAWEVVTLSVLDGAEASATLPTAWIDALYALAGRSDMEEALAHIPTGRDAP